MKWWMNAGIAVMLGALSVSALAEERPDHFQGKKAESLGQAVAYLEVYGERLEDILEKDELSASDMAEVHQLTYTLENALQTVRESLKGTAATLEEVHLASETMDKETVKERGRRFLSDIDTLID